MKAVKDAIAQINPDEQYRPREIQDIHPFLGEYLKPHTVYRMIRERDQLDAVDVSTSDKWPMYLIDGDELISTLKSIYDVQ